MVRCARGAWIGIACLTCLAGWAAPPQLHLSPKGDDATGDGSPTKPYRTLTRAARDAKPGTRLRLAGGVYARSTDRLTLVGTPEAPITLESDGSGTPILDGEGVGEKVVIEAEAKAGIFSILSLIRSKHVVVRGLELRNSVGKGLQIWESEHITVENCRIHDTWSSGLGGVGDHLRFEGNEVWRASMMNENDLVLKQREKGLKTYWSGGGGTWRHEDGTLVRDIVWRKNHIHHVWGEGLGALHVDGGVYEGNTIHDCYSVLLYIDHSRGVRVEGNFLYNSAPQFLRVDTKDLPAGIGIASEKYESAVPTAARDLQILNNVISGTSVGIFFWRDPDNKDPSNRYENVTVAHNLIHANVLLPVSFGAIVPAANEKPSNLFANNLVMRPLLSAEGDGKPMLTRFKNPELWTQRGNLLGVEAEKVALRDPHALGPLGALGFVPRGTTPRGAPVPGVEKDFTGKKRGAQPTTGPFEK